MMPPRNTPNAGFTYQLAKAIGLIGLGVLFLGGAWISLVMKPKTAQRRPLNVLILADDNRLHADTVLSHISALRDLSRHNVKLFNPRWLRSSLSLDLDEFDAVMIHYSIVLIEDNYLSPSFREKLRGYRGLKVQFVQDDYRWINKMTDMQKYLGINVVYTLAGEKEIPKVWGALMPGTRVLNTMAGYVPNWTVPDVPRTIDVGYRGRSVPWWLGRIGQDKIKIGQGFLERAPAYGLHCDIAWEEGSRIYGNDWIRFIASCKAVLATESGATITDFDGKVEAGVKEYRAAHPGADFDEVFSAVLAPYEDNVHMTLMSPRIFEAALLRTGLICFEGEYSGVIEPWLHYLPLAKDFSNMAEVVAHLKNSEFMQGMINRTYQDLVASGKYSYQAFVTGVDHLLAEMARPISRGVMLRYRLALAERPLDAVCAQLYWLAALTHDGTLPAKAMRYLKNRRTTI